LDVPVEPIELTDDRLLLRPPRQEDAHAVHRACQDPEIQRWTTIPSPYTRENADEYVADMSPTGWATGEGASFGVFDRATGELLGSIALMHIGERDAATGGRAELGYWCAPWARGRGVMTDAARLVCRWGFEHLRLARIDWYAELGNEGSRRIAENLGFTIEGIQRQRLVNKGERRDGWVGGLLAGELR